MSVFSSFPWPARCRRAVLVGNVFLTLAGCGPAADDLAPLVKLKVNGETAYANAAEFVAIGPRPSGSEGARQAAAWIAGQCRALGYDTTVAEWQEPTTAGERTFRNVRATLPGRRNAPILLIASHYDTKLLPAYPAFVGANDSGSSTAALLEVMRVLGQVRPWAGLTLQFLFFDGEECVTAYGPRDGLHGSRHLAREIESTRAVGRYRAMILLDMIGDRDLRITIPPDTDPELARRLLRLAERQGVADRVSFFLQGNLTDDHTPFQSLGIPSIDLIDFDYGPGNGWWHTDRDTMDRLSPQSLATAGNLCLGLILDLSRPQTR